MKCVLAAALVLAAGMTGASAAGYDDFTRGLTENLRGNSEKAITAFTAALAAPDLVPTYKSAAYRGRASAYLQLDQCQEAMADLTAYENLKSRDRTILVYRIWTELCLKDAAGAQKDLEAASNGSVVPVDLWEFARLEWRYGLFEESMKAGAEAFKKADKEAVAASYILLWQAVAAQRAGKFDAAAITAGLAQTKLDDWPKPLFDLYLGKQTPAGVQKEATSWRQSKEDAQVCEANFYTAEWHLGRGDKDAAVPLLLAVAAKCPVDFIELSAAMSELKRLGVPVPQELER